VVHDDRLLVGHATFDDAGVYRLNDDVALVQTVDFFPPVCDDPYQYGLVAAANSLSDVYAMGGEPLTALSLVCYPHNELDLSILGEILRGGSVKCAEAKCTIAGGHSLRDNEIKFGLSVTGLVHPSRVTANDGARPGDRLFLTKPLGMGNIVTAYRKRAISDEQIGRAHV
jgi:selenide,water dikinase